VLANVQAVRAESRYRDTLTLKRRSGSSKRQQPHMPTVPKITQHERLDLPGWLLL